MFGENLKTLRKQKGFSQEELATRLHVVRQTISKWEKNLSVPTPIPLSDWLKYWKYLSANCWGQKLKMKIPPVMSQSSYQG